MTDVVVDTNVLLVANNSHDDVSVECVQQCIERLQSVTQDGRVFIDDQYLIISEYMNKTNIKPPKGVGDVFLKWLLSNRCNSSRVVNVAITQENDDLFAEFSDKALQSEFDPPDRKFVAVASGSPDKPMVWQAADCKWVDWHQRLKAMGVTVEFLCPDDVCRFYEKKFPTKPKPEL